MKNIYTNKGLRNKNLNLDKAIKSKKYKDIIDILENSLLGKNTNCIYINKFGINLFNKTLDSYSQQQTQTSEEFVEFLVLLRLIIDISIPPYGLKIENIKLSEDDFHKLSEDEDDFHKLSEDNFHKIINFKFFELALYILNTHKYIPKQSDFNKLIKFISNNNIKDDYANSLVQKMLTYGYGITVIDKHFKEVSIEKNKKLFSVLFHNYYNINNFVELPKEDIVPKQVIEMLSVFLNYYNLDAAFYKKIVLTIGEYTYGKDHIDIDLI